MSNETANSSRYPLLEDLLKEKGFQLKGIYTNRDVARIFGVSPRTIQEWSYNGKLPARNLPGHGKFLSQDIETLLRDSSRKSELLDHEQGTLH
jgi:hypothetical protein